MHNFLVEETGVLVLYPQGLDQKTEFVQETRTPATGFETAALDVRSSALPLSYTDRLTSIRLALRLSFAGAGFHPAAVFLSCLHDDDNHQDDLSAVWLHDDDESDDALLLWPHDGGEGAFYLLLPAHNCP